ETVTIGLTPPRDYRPGIKLALRSGSYEVHGINTGVPHVVMFVPDVEQVPVAELGSEIRWHSEFAPAGTNVNFVQILEPGHIRVRTFERGVEGETLACGTGITASALICALLKGFKSPVKVRAQGGDTLEVGFEKRGDGFDAVCLTGPAEFVFDGEIDL
ncbi:MAG: diaminopimelate epimerase, partial [Verrucomicrobiae bacterium]|nr:diaminopimelate epimerase [Verrucomicrobiae bacterium]